MASDVRRAIGGYGATPVVRHGDEYKEPLNARVQATTGKPRKTKHVRVPTNRMVTATGVFPTKESLEFFKRLREEATAERAQVTCRDRQVTHRDRTVFPLVPVPVAKSPSSSSSVPASTLPLPVIRPAGVEEGVGLSRGSGVASVTNRADMSRKKLSVHLYNQDRMLSRIKRGAYQNLTDLDLGKCKLREDELVELILCLPKLKSCTHGGEYVSVDELREIGTDPSVALARLHI